MFGVISQKSNSFLMSVDLIDGGGGNFSNGGGGGGGSSIVTVSAPQGGTELFDLSVLSGLRSSDKYLGRNTVSDIQSTYQTYITGSPIGRGGQYALDSARKYGVSLVEAARGYLLGAGINIIPTVTTQTTQQTDTTTNTNTNVDTTKKDNTVVTEKNPFQILADILPTLFGNAVYNPPLQSQAYGYSPTTSEQPLTQATGGSSIGLLVIVGIVGIAGYFLYKRFKK